MSSRKRARGPARARVLGREGLNALADGALVTFVRRPFPASEAASIYQQLAQQTNWQRRELTVYGKKVPEPRSVCYQGASPALQYAYSGVTLTPEPFDDVVLRVLAAAMPLFPDLAAAPPNTCLMNKYEHGGDHLAYHSDFDLRRYGPAPLILSVSFGTERDFFLRRKADHEDQVEFRLGAGAALLMHGSCQATWEHSVPKRAAVPGGRVNLTFRHVLQH